VQPKPAKRYRKIEPGFVFGRAAFQVVLERPDVFGRRPALRSRPPNSASARFGPASLFRCGAEVRATEEGFSASMRVAAFRKFTEETPSDWW
jgi:hypothetical protein